MKKCYCEDFMRFLSEVVELKLSLNNKAVPYMEMIIRFKEKY